MQRLSAVLFALSLLILTGCTLPFLSPMEQTSPVVTDTGALEQPVQEEEIVIEPVEEEAEFLDLSTIEITSNGTEPFWSFQASGTNLVFQDPETIEIYTISMTQTPTTIIITGSGFDALLTLDTCSDGMSDIVYGYTSIVTKGSDVLGGCANITL